MSTLQLFGWLIGTLAGTAIGCAIGLPLVGWINKKQWKKFDAEMRQRYK